MGQGCRFTDVSRSEAGRPGQHPLGVGGRLIPTGAGGQHGPYRSVRARVWAPAVPWPRGSGLRRALTRPPPSFESPRQVMSQVEKKQRARSFFKKFQLWCIFQTASG